MPDEISKLREENKILREAIEKRKRERGGTCPVCENEDPTYHRTDCVLYVRPPPPTERYCVRLQGWADIDQDCGAYDDCKGRPWCDAPPPEPFLVLGDKVVIAPMSYGPEPVEAEVTKLRDYWFWAVDTRGHEWHVSWNSKNLWRDLAEVPPKEEIKEFQLRLEPRDDYRYRREDVIGDSAGCRDSNGEAEG